MNPSWQNLSALRTTPILSIGYAGAFLVPICAYFLISIPAFATTALPLSLFFLFIGSITLAFAHLLNEIMCPVLVKQHGTVDLYRLHLSAFLSQKSIIEQEVTKIKNNFAEQNLLETFSTMSIPSDISKKIAEVIGEKTQMLSDKSFYQDYGRELKNYKSIWQTQDQSCPGIRRLIAALYLIACLITLGLAVRQIMIVFIATFSRG